MADISLLFRRFTFLIRILEVILTIVCVSVYFDVWGGKIGVTCGTFFAFIIISLTLLIGMVIGEELSKKVTLLLLTMAAIFFIVSGGIVADVASAFQNFSRLWGEMVGTSILAFIISAVYIMDIIFTFREEVSA